MFNLFPKDTKFIEMITQMSSYVVNATALLVKLCDEPASQAVLKDIKDVEHKADDLAHQVFGRLDAALITPFDREDIHHLIERMDDIIDDIDALAKRFDIFGITAVPPAFREQAKNLTLATAELGLAIQQFSGKSIKIASFKPNIINIHNIESKADGVHYEVMREMFKPASSGLANSDNINSVLDIIKWKELYDYIEDAIDSCEDVANMLERVALKNG